MNSFFKVLNIAFEYSEEEFDLSNGEKSHHYFDFRKLLSYPKGMDIVIKEIIDLTQDLEFSCVCGVPMGGIPFASRFASKMNIPEIMVRKERKTYGKRNIIEGDCSIFDYTDKKVLLIEDVITTGKSIEKFEKILLEEGFSVVKMCILSRKPKPDGVVVVIPDLIRRFFTCCKKDGKNIQRVIPSLDIEDPEEVLRLTELLGPKVPAIKYHFDLICFATVHPKDFFRRLKDASIELEFLIIDDRKYQDIPRICEKIASNTRSIVDISTVMPITGLEVIDVIAGMGIGVILIRDLSTEGDFLSEVYKSAMEDILETRRDIVGYVGREKVQLRADHLRFTPGISASVKEDGSHKYLHPSQVSQGTFMIVGRGIYATEDPLKALDEYLKK